jgi:two-component system, NtrC family, response regulator AtoC
MVMNDTGRIIIADDEDLVLQTTAALLEAEGFECDCVPDAQGVHDLLGRGAYDLLITDWKMAGNANLELVQAIHDSGGGIPVIVVTGYPHLLEVVKQHNLTVFAHVVKPFEFDAFLEIVRDGVAHSRRQPPQANGHTPPAAPLT